MGNNESSWCSVCCTRHDTGPACPGELGATSAERYGWRTQVMAGRRVESYGVLVAEAGDLWRARILTFPNMLWSVPGGRGTMKFVGKTAQEAEKRAREFIEQRCKARGLTLRKSAVEVEAGPVHREQALVSEGSGKQERFLRSFPVTYGREKTTQAATTVDLSANGLFVATNRPLARGNEIKLRLELEGFSVPLAGKVVWVRLRPDGGRPAGMGVQLTTRPALYQRYVSELAKKMRQQEQEEERKNREQQEAQQSDG